MGLSLLLLGTAHGSTESQSKLQHLIQSVNHLKVASHMSSGTNESIYLASIHNLALAHLALDSLRLGHESQLLDFISSVETPSSVLLVNKGSRLLQLGKTNEAVDILNHTAQELFCDSNEASDSYAESKRRQNEVCSLLQQNLILADDVIRGTQSEITDIATNSTDSDASQVSELNTIPVNSISDDPLTSNEVSIETEDDLSANLIPDESNVTEAPNEGIESTSLQEVDEDVNTKSPQLQNALHALENAASEGVQRPRLLLALAKARAST